MFTLDLESFNCVKFDFKVTVIKYGNQSTRKKCKSVGVLNFELYTRKYKCQLGIPMNKH